MNYPEIIPVDYGKTTIPESMVYDGGDKTKIQPIVLRVYLIKTENKLILVDAGCVTMPGFTVTEFIGPVKALEKINISASDITDVIITHSHHDHIECVSYFENATVHIQKDEYAQGKQYFTEKSKINLFEDELQLTDKIKVVKSGGHSVGSCVIEIETENKPIAIIGDECYKRECLERQIPTGCFCSKEKSVAFIKKYGNGDYNVLLCHDI